jgi:hypothetical protein
VGIRNSSQPLLLFFSEKRERGYSFMKLLLIADPPASNQWRKHLEEMGAVVTVMTSDRVRQVFADTDYVLAMNLGQHKRSIISSAEKVQVPVLHVPPSWTAGLHILKPVLDKLEASKPKAATVNAGGLTHQPLSDIKKAIEYSRPVFKLPEVPAPAPTPKAVDSSVEAKIETVRRLLAVAPTSKHDHIQDAVKAAHGGVGLASSTVKKLREEALAKIPIEVAAKVQMHNPRKPSGSTRAERQAAANKLIVASLKRGEEPDFTLILSGLHSQFGGEGIDEVVFDRLVDEIKKVISEMGLAPIVQSPTLLVDTEKLRRDAACAKELILDMVKTHHIKNMSFVVVDGKMTEPVFIEHETQVVTTSTGQIEV